jgi:malonyl-CoA O-methyltransferase
MDERTTRLFNRAAGRYHDSADVQRRVAEHLVAWMSAAWQPDRILEIGCGTGVLTAKLRAAFPAAGIVATDPSPAMVCEARARLPDREIAWAVGNPLRADSLPGGAFALIASSSALHWARPLDRALAHLAERLATGGRFAAALMIDGTLDEVRRARAAAAPGKPAAPLPGRAGVEAALTAAGLAVERIEAQDMPERHASAEALLDSLRARGVTGVAMRAGGALTRGELAALKKSLEETRRRGYGEELVVTYRVLTWIARRTEHAGSRTSHS